MKIKTRDGELNFEIRGMTRLQKIFEELNINPDIIIASVNGTLRTPDFAVKESDEVEFIYTISGG